MSDRKGTGRRKWWRMLTGEIVRRYFDHDVGRQSAALAYYLLFMLFPILIFVGGLLGLLDLDRSRIIRALAPLLPQRVLGGLALYLEHVARVYTPARLWSALVPAVWFPMRSAECLMGAVRRAWQLPREKNRLRHRVHVLLFTVFLLTALAVTLLLMSLGQKVLERLREALQAPLLPEWGWNAVRFALLGAVMFAAIGFLYAVARDNRRPWCEILPGALSALVAWLALSAGYAWYVEHIANYDRLYGTLGTAAMLLVWLYLTAVILIMGAECNGAVDTLRGK